MARYLLLIAVILIASFLVLGKISEMNVKTLNKTSEVLHKAVEDER